ncbi:PIN domain-containing protein, partial [Candidatus Methanoperedens nitratireducens]|uniref:PIN domain-containing protein n=1 Tax=Candidatus Methanoperedens nitratireducens TaxID=1392998 RepID=UPI001C53AE48
MKIVIDTSTLISLAKIDAIKLLENIEGELICPYEVFREAVVEGREEGHKDAEIIAQIFDSKLLLKVDVLNNTYLKGISKTDSIVISCVIEHKTKYLFANDTKDLCVNNLP